MWPLAGEENTSVIREIVKASFKRSVYTDLLFLAKYIVDKYRGWVYYEYIPTCVYGN